MTADVVRSPLGRRLLAAFVLVALSSVGALTLAALVATDQGLAQARRSGQELVASRAADAAADAFSAAGSWSAAELADAVAIAQGAGARLVIHDDGGAMVWPGRGRGPGAGPHEAPGDMVDVPVVVDGTRVGTARLTFARATGSDRTVAWSWVMGAAAVALAAALLVSGFVVRRLTRALTGMTRAANRFASGDRTARAALDSPGELGELARALDTMADEVVSAEQSRSRQAADVAHELRTPLAALQAGLEELRDGLRAPDQLRLGELHDQTLRLGRVVSDLADLSAAESATVSLRLTEVDLSAVAATAIAAQRPHLDAAGLLVRTELRPVLVRADPDRLHQAVVNLLTNTVRYCRPGDHVDVSVGTQDSTAVLEVADTGPGIPADELPHVFDRLWRGRQARTVTGSGIGLAVVRELVVAHGGVVCARRRGTADTGGGGRGVDTIGTRPAGSGTVMSIRLPVAEVPGKRPTRPWGEDPARGATALS